MAEITHVIKRSGAKVRFNPLRISNAIYRAAIAVGGRDRKPAEGLAKQVVEILKKNYSDDDPPHVEDIQDIVEQVLIKNGHDEVAKEYILSATSRTGSGKRGIKNYPIPRRISRGQNYGKCSIGLQKMISIQLQK